MCTILHHGIAEQGFSMSRKFALKRLTASDLTFFRWHYQNRPAGNQKAINLDSKVLVGELFPQLGQAGALPQPRVNLELVLQGPGSAPAHTLVRKILKQQKNWRLNGEFIENPLDEPDRYNVLVPDDYALIEFSGDDVPSQVKLHLIAQNVPADAQLFSAIRAMPGNDSMWLVGEEELASLLRAADVAQTHPLMDWVEGADVEDAARGGAEGIRKINQRRDGRGMTPEELLRARAAAQRIGVAGESLVNEHLDAQRSERAIHEFEWTSSVNAVSPCDFKVESIDGAVRSLDVKSTSGSFATPIHMSRGEIEYALTSPGEYGIYRVYEMSDGAAKLRIANDIRTELRPIFDAILALPEGATVDSVSIDPRTLPFSDEIIHLQERAA